VDNKVIGEKESDKNQVPLEDLAQLDLIKIKQRMISI
jgi:hypothetical protein